MRDILELATSPALNQRTIFMYLKHCQTATSFLHCQTILLKSAGENLAGLLHALRELMTVQGAKLTVQ